MKADLRPRPKGSGLVIGLALMLSTSMASCAGDDDEAATNLAACGADGTTERREADPEDASTFVITDVRRETVQGDCERLIFDLEPSSGGTGLAYGVSYRQGPLAGPTGPIEVDGETILEVVLRGSSADSALEAPELGGESDLFVDAVELPEVPGGAVWAFGVAQRRPFTVTVEENATVQLIVTFGSSVNG